jgi:hypothetical protein
MTLTDDRGIVERIIEHRGLPFALDEPRVIQVVEWRDGHQKPLYGVIFEGELESETGVIVWAAE